MSDEEGHERFTNVEWSYLTPYAVIDYLEEMHPLRYRELKIEGTGPHVSEVFIWICDEEHVHMGYGPDTRAYQIVVTAAIAFAITRILDTKQRIPRRPGKKVVERVIAETRSRLAEIAPPVAALFMEHVHTLHNWLENHRRDDQGQAQQPPRARAPRQPARVPVGTAPTQPAPPKPLLASKEVFDKALQHSLMMSTFNGHVVVGLFTGQPIPRGDA